MGWKSWVVIVVVCMLLFVIIGVRAELRAEDDCKSQGGVYYQGGLSGECYPTQCQIDGYMFCSCRAGCYK